MIIAVNKEVNPWAYWNVGLIDPGDSIHQRNKSPTSGTGEDYTAGSDSYFFDKWDERGTLYHYQGISNIFSMISGVYALVFRAPHAYKSFRFNLASEEVRTVALS